FAVVALGDLAAEQMPHQLNAVADAEHGDAELEDRRIRDRGLLRKHAAGTAGEDDADDAVGAQLFGTGLVVIDLRIDLALANAASDDLGVLRTEVDVGDGLGHGQKVKKTPTGGGEQERLRARGKARSAPPPHPRFAVRLAGLKLQADVFVSAARADGGFVVALNRMNVTATHAMEGGVPALLLETRVVATVIVAPQSQKDGGDQQAINDGGGLQIHADERPAKPARSPPTSQTA